MTYTVRVGDYWDEIRGYVVELSKRVRAECVVAYDGSLSVVAHDGDVNGLDTTRLARRFSDTADDSPLPESLFDEGGLNIFDSDQGVNIHARVLAERLMVMVVYKSSSTGIVILQMKEVAVELERLARDDPRLTRFGLKR